MKKYFVIDADGHIGEDDLGYWHPIKYLPERWRSQAPQIIPVSEGTFRMKRFMIEGHVMPRATGKGVSLHGPVGNTVKDMGGRPAGMHDPESRIKDMDLDGIDIAVLFGEKIGGVGASGLDNGDLAAALASAYNSWVADFCESNPDRLKAVVCLALQDIATASVELRRCVKEHAFVGAVIAPNFNGMHLGESYFDPLYAEAQEADIPICSHASTNGAGPRISIPGAEFFDKFFFTHMPHHCFAQMLASLSVIGGGVLDRFPRLRYAFMEAWSGWLPFWMERMQHHWEKLGVQIQIKQSPMEYIQEGRLFFACEPGEKNLAHVVQTIGDDHLFYASDYWHWDSEFPGTVREIEERKELSERTKMKILGENASRLFKLPVRVTA